MSHPEHEALAEAGTRAPIVTLTEAEMPAEAEPPASIETLTAVLGSVPLIGRGNLLALRGESTIRAAAAAMDPLLASVRAAREDAGEAWSGRVHRRVRWRRLEPSVSGELPAVSGELPAAVAQGAGKVVRLTSRSWRKGAWGLVTVTSHLDGLEVTHELARRVDAAQTRHRVTSLTPTPREALRGTSASPVLRGPAPTEPSSQGTPGTLRPSSRRISLTPGLLRRWARVSGDDNDIHLVPGAGAACGLAVGEGGLVAHGMLLLALSACLDRLPLAGEARFPAPLSVAPAGSSVSRVMDDAGAWVGLEGPAGLVVRVRPLPV